MNKILLVLVVVLAVLCVVEAFVIAGHSGREFETQVSENLEFRFYSASPFPFQETIEYGENGQIDQWDLGMIFHRDQFGNFSVSLNKDPATDEFETLALHVTTANGNLVVAFNDKDADKNPDSLSMLVSNRNRNHVHYSDINLDGVFDTRVYEKEGYIFLNHAWHKIGEGGTGDNVDFPKRVLAETGEEYTFASGRWMPSSEL